MTSYAGRAINEITPIVRFRISGQPVNGGTARVSLCHSRQLGAARRPALVLSPRHIIQSRYLFSREAPMSEGGHATGSGPPHRQRFRGLTVVGLE